MKEQFKTLNAICAPFLNMDQQTELNLGSSSR